MPLDLCIQNPVLFNQNHMSEKFNAKRYYTIREVADQFGVSRSLVRFWEGEFPSLQPRKLENGERRYTAGDVEQFGLIYNLVKERGFTLAGAQQELKRHRQFERNRSELLEKLRAIRQNLQEIRDEL